MIVVISYEVSRVTNVVACLKVGNESYQLDSKVTFLRGDELGRFARAFVKKWYDHSKTLDLPFGLEGDVVRSYTEDPIYSEAVAL